MDKVLAALGIFGLPAIIIAAVVMHPDKVEKWAALFWKLLARFKDVFRGAHKTYLRHDLQGRVNDFVKRIRKSVPDLPDERLVVEWVDPNTERSAFLDGGKVVLRLRRNDPEDHNFMHGAYLFVSTSLLRKPKRYLSQTQRESLDLYVCTKLIETEKEQVVGAFLDHYLHPKTADQKSKIALMFDSFAIVDRAGMLFPLLIKELGYLGDKVFGRRRDDLIQKEVTDVVEFLKPIATRKIGDTGDLNFHGSYCKFGIVLCGRPMKISVSIRPYLTYIQKNLVDKSVETIYLVFRQENSAKVTLICRHFEQSYEKVMEYSAHRLLDYGGRRQMVKQHVVALRKRARTIVFPSTEAA